MLVYNSILILIGALLSCTITADPRINNNNNIDHNNNNIGENSIVQEEVKTVVQTQREDIFSSTSKLEELVDNELQVVDLLDTFADFVSERADIIRS